MTPGLFLDSEDEPKPLRKLKILSCPSEKPRSAYCCPDLGFHFTDDEKRLMQLHCRAAAVYMKTYGQAPALPQIDLSHYINSKSEPQCQTKNTK